MIWRFTLSNTTQGTLVLSDEPMGWADIVLNIKRDMKWHGVFFEYAINLHFYGEGYDYLKAIYNSGGIDENVQLLVEQKNTDADAFASFYTGKLLLGKIIFDCQDDCVASCPIDPSGCLMQFKNRIDQPVDLNSNLDFDGDALASYGKLPFEMELLPKHIIIRELADITDPVNGSLFSTYLSPSHTISPDVMGGQQNVVYFDYMSIATGTFTLNEVNAIEQLGVIMDSDAGNMPVLIVTPFSGTFNIDVAIPTLKFSFLLSAASFNLVGTFVITVNGGIVYSNTVISTNVQGSYTVSNLHWNQDIALNTNDVVKVFIIFEISAYYDRDPVFPYDVHVTYNDTTLSPAPTIFSSIDIYGTTISDPTQCKVFAINESLSRAVEAITDDCMRVKSDYFGRTDSEPYTSASDGCGSLEVITKGLLIRNFPIATTVMAVSFKQMFEALNSIHNIGIGPEPDTTRGGGYEVIRVEPMEYFYDSTILLTLDNVPTIKKTVMAEWYPSTIEFGYDKWETESSMGLDEFCTKRNYRTTLKEISNTISNTCKFIASGYSIEVTRRQQYIDQSTVDFRYDNDIFIICARRRSSDIVLEQGIDCANSLTNIIDPDTIYNYRISPIRNLMRWVKSYMAAYFTNINAADAKFVFTNGDGNFMVQGELVTGCFAEDGAVAENSDINVAAFLNANYAKPIFKNEIDEFDYPLSLTEFNLIQANPRGTIKYRKQSTDNYSEGFIYGIQYKPNEGLATFNILPKYT